MAKTETAQPPMVEAKARYVRTAPRKVRVVADQIRGMEVEKAIAMLTFSPRGASVPILKLIRSAAANAENNHDLDVDDLVVSQAFVGKALVLKRFHARARGRGARILKPFANLTIVVREVPTAEAA